MEAFEKIPNQQLKAIKQIVAFGFGSYETVFQWHTDAHFGLPRDVKLILVATRHHVIQDLQTMIEKASEGDKVEVFLQDEGFTDRDKKSLEGLQFESLNDPAGYLKIDKNTLVVSFEEEADTGIQLLNNTVMQVQENAVMQIIADIAGTEKPAMIIHKKIEKEDWDDYKATEEDPNGVMRPLKGESMDSTSPRVQELIEQYDEVDFHVEDQPGDSVVVFPDTRLYVRKGLGQA